MFLCQAGEKVLVFLGNGPTRSRRLLVELLEFSVSLSPPKPVPDFAKPLDDKVDKLYDFAGGGKATVRQLPVSVFPDGPFEIDVGRLRPHESKISAKEFDAEVRRRLRSPSSSRSFFRSRICFVVLVTFLCSAALFSADVPHMLAFLLLSYFLFCPFVAFVPCPVVPLPCAVRPSR